MALLTVPSGDTMNRVLILQFMDTDAPAYLGSWLDRHGVAADVRLAAANAFPDRIEGYAALALLGGEMSVNDDLPFLRTAERLIDQAMQRDLPVLGHCLGGQLMARVLGAPVGASPAPEVGWHRMDRLVGPLSEQWFGPEPSQQVFHWHFEAFGLPRGAQSLGTSPQCPHQAFAIGRHLALQFHVEVDAAKVELWLRQPDEQYLQAQERYETAHGPQQIRLDTLRCLTAHQRLADRIYRRWGTAAGLLSQ